jgi:hypothetical protein
MGASGWHYFVPFQPDIKAVLDQLREDVFDKGEYLKPALFYGALMHQVGDQLEPNVVDEVNIAIEDFKKRPEPQSIEELIEMNAEMGTHSIIDIHEISEEPGFGVIAPMPEKMVTNMFGTHRPNHSQIESKVDELFMNIRACYYVLVYKNDSPDEIFFIGFSGD